MDRTKIVYATDRRFVGNGVVEKGSHWPADDPIVVQHPDLFSDDPRYGLSFSVPPNGWDDPPVETATAAPGEKRQTRRGTARGGSGE